MSEARGEARPPGGGGRPFSATRAAILLVIAVALGVYLISLAEPARKKPASARNPSTTHSSTPTTAPPTTTTTTAPPSGVTSRGTAPTSAVKVLVANASQTNGVAGYYSGTLSSAGWGTLTPVTALTTESSSSVYYAKGDKGAAETIAASLGVTSGSVAALSTSAVPLSSTTGVDVVVVAGFDLAAKMPAGG